MKIFIIFPSSQLTQRDVENTIDRETSGDFGKGLLTMGNLDHTIVCLCLQKKYQNGNSEKIFL